MGDGASKPSMTKRNSFGSAEGLATETRGNEDTLEYRIDTKNEQGKTISLWHDINVNHIDSEGKETEYLNFVCEIPKFTRYEQISLQELPMVYRCSAVVLVPNESWHSL